MRKSAPGFTLIESLIGAAVLGIFFAAVTIMVQQSVQLIGEARVAMVAQTIAQERLEIIRNMPYAEVGTVGGIVPGPLPLEEVITVNNQDFSVQTFIQYHDDPFDGLFPEDDLPNDYKKVEIKVNWGGIFASKNPISLYTNISAKSGEVDLGGGIISIIVFNALGEIIPGAEVKLEATELNPPVDTKVYTDTTGRVYLPGASNCHECYKVSVSKSGYTTDQTFGSNEVENPAKPHLSVLPGQLTETSFTIDLPSSVTFRAVRSGTYIPFNGVQMRIRGSKEKGRNTLDEPVYVYDQQIVTGSGGSVTVSNLTWDRYHVSLPSGSSVDFAGSWPFSPFSLLPGTSQEFTLVVDAATPRNLLVTVEDNAAQPISQASVELVNSAVGFIATQSTNALDKPDRSQAYFRDLPDTLIPYQLRIIADGFDDVYTETTISGKLKEIFILSPNQ